MRESKLKYYVDNLATESMIKSCSAMSSDKVCDMLHNFVEKSVGESIDKVVCYDERIDYGGFCETCSYEDYVIDIYFTVNDSNDYYKYTFNGSMSDLLMYI